MAIGAGTFTLADYALYSNNPLFKNVAMSLIDYGNVLQDIPMPTIQSLIQNGVRFEGNVPADNWVPLNSEALTVHAQTTPFSEQVYIFRESVDVDKYIVMDRNQITDPRASQTKMVLKGLTYGFNNKFLKNDHLTGDVNAPVGLRFRIDDAASQNRYGVRPESKILAASGGLDLTQATLV